MNSRNYMSGRQWLLFCAALLALAAVFSYPLILYFTVGMPYSFMPVSGLEVIHQHPGDYIQLMYRFWLFEKAVTGEIPFFRNAYEFSTPLTPPLFNPQGIPISAIFMLFMPLGNIAAYNALIFLSFMGAGIAMALLVREFTGSPGASVVCGLLYSCIPNRLGHLYGGHMGGFIFFLMPLAMYCMERAWRCASGDRSSIRGAFAWGFGCGLCSLCAVPIDLHISFYMGILLVIFFLVRFAGHTAREGMRSALRASRLVLWGLLLPVAVTVSYLLWVKFCYLATSVVGAGRSIRTVQAYSPMLVDIFYKSPNAEKNVCLGLLPLIGATYGFFVRRREIRRRRAEPGALLWLYFWAGLFVVAYMLSLGTALEAHIPMYAWLHAHIPFMSYSRTSSRIVAISLLGFFILVAYGLRHLLSKGRQARVAVVMLTVLALADYHPKGRIGVSLLHGMDSVYEKVRREAQGKRLLELPIWPGDSAWSAIYEHYATLTGVPIVNGYSPVPQLAYVTRVFEPMKSLNLGEMRKWQYDMLKSWDVPFIILHQDLFPRRVSRYPFRFTLLNLMRSPYLRFLMKNGPNHLFALTENPAGPETRFAQRSPVGNLYPSNRMKSDVGSCIQDAAASSGFSLCAGTHGESGGLLAHGNALIYPTGEYSVFFNLKSDAPRGSGPVARIDVYAPESEKVLAERLIRAGDFARPGEYRLFELRFVNREPAPLEFRVHYLGNSVLGADFVYVLFSGEKDPCTRYEAEDLFHIGSCVEDPSSSGGYAITITKDEDITMPMVSGPDRLYGPGCYRASFYLKARDAEAGTIASLDVASSFGGVRSKRDLRREELKESAGYSPYEVMFTLDRTTPLSFAVRHYKRAILSLDKIEIEEIPPGDFLSHAADDKLAR